MVMITTALTGRDVGAENSRCKPYTPHSDLRKMGGQWWWSSRRSQVEMSAPKILAASPIPPLRSGSRGNGTRQKDDGVGLPVRLPDTTCAHVSEPRPGSGQIGRGRARANSR